MERSMATMAALALVACSKGAPAPPPSSGSAVAGGGEEIASESTSDVVSNRPPVPFRLTSPAFAEGEEIPRRFTCEGEDIAPALAWTEPPPDTASLAFFIADPDAPDPAAPKVIWTHEVIYDLDPGLRGLPEGRTSAPDGARDGTNDWKRTGYGGPCPPIGRHRYVHTLLALDIRLDDLGALTRPDLLLAAEGHVVDKAVLVGTYEKTGE